jgi:hypothetical protein
MTNKTWKAVLSWQVGNFPKAVFIGRKPTPIADPKHKKALLALGVFEEVGQGLRYKGEAFYADDDKQKVHIDMNGKLTKEKGQLKMSAERIAEIEKEFE